MATLRKKQNGMLPTLAAPLGGLHHTYGREVAKLQRAAATRTKSENVVSSGSSSSDCILNAKTPLVPGKLLPGMWFWVNFSCPVTAFRDLTLKL
jgi:hypothetical protein